MDKLWKSSLLLPGFFHGKGEDGCSVEHSFSLQQQEAHISKACPAKHFSRGKDAVCRHCVIQDCFNFSSRQSSFIYLVHLSSASCRNRSHEVCMLKWLLVGEGDIWAANYYVLSCSSSLMALFLSLNISGQDWVFSQGEREKKCLLWTRMHCRSISLSMLLTAHCVTRHVIWTSECKLSEFFHFLFFLNPSVKGLTFNLDSTILQFCTFDLMPSKAAAE